MAEKPTVTHIVAQMRSRNLRAQRRARGRQTAGIRRLARCRRGARTGGPIGTMPRGRMGLAALATKTTTGSSTSARAGPPRLLGHRRPRPCSRRPAPRPCRVRRGRILARSATATCGVRAPARSGQAVLAGKADLAGRAGQAGRVGLASQTSSPRGLGRGQPGPCRWPGEPHVPSGPPCRLAGRDVPSGLVALNQPDVRGAQDARGARIDRGGRAVVIGRAGRISRRDTTLIQRRRLPMTSRRARGPGALSG